MKGSTMSRGAGSSRVRPPAQGWGSLFSLGGSASSPTHLELVPLLLHTHTHLLERENWPRPAWPQPELWTPPGVRISPALWGNPQLWGSVHPVGKGVHADTHAHGHTHSHPVVHGGSQTHTPRHTRPGGLGSKKVPPVFGSNEPLCWCPFPPTGVPQGTQPSWVWGPGHWPFLCFPCTDSLPTRHPQTHFI